MLSLVLDAPLFLPLTLLHTLKTGRGKKEERILACSQYLSPILRVDLQWKQKDVNDFNPQ